MLLQKFYSSSYNAIKKECESICSKRNIAFEWNLIQENKACCLYNEKMNQVLALSVEGAGYKVITINKRRRPLCCCCFRGISVVMLFVRCFKGISHNPLEDVELKISFGIKVP